MPVEMLIASDSARAGSTSNRDVIVNGGSAGTTAAFKEILNQMPNDLSATVFVVPRITPQDVSATGC